MELSSGNLGLLMLLTGWAASTVVDSRIKNWSANTVGFLSSLGATYTVWLVLYVLNEFVFHIKIV